jgi:membrane protease subunit (stomatin/prohibitin family)
MCLAGFRRRGRRRGLVVGAAAGAAMARRGQNQANNDAPQAPAEDGMTTQLEELQKLKEQGILTQAEFDAKKKQVLGI